MDGDSITPLHSATEVSHDANIVKMLLHAGAYVVTVDHHGTPLHSDPSFTTANGLLCLRKHDCFR